MERYTRQYESILDPVKDKLNPNIFKNDDILSKVSSHILNSFLEWLIEVDEGNGVKSAVLLGSSASYQYTDSSDIDVNIVLNDISRNEELRKILPNGNLLPGTSHPINYFLASDMSPVEQSDVAFDLLDSKWIKKPSKDTTIIPYSYVMEIAKLFMSGIDDRIQEYTTDVNELNYYKSLPNNEINRDDIKEKIDNKLNEIRADLDAIHIVHHLIKSFRREAYDPDFNATYLVKIESDNPNYSINNIVYKILENSGYFEKLEKYEQIRKNMLGR